MDRIITVSIIGVGARGGEAYGRYIFSLKDKYKITNLCDINIERLEKWGNIFEVPNSNRFSSEEEFFKEKRSDLLLVTTLDRLHVEMAKKALKLGYDILLEKPISDLPEELRSLELEANKSGRKVIVCHVLRYTSMMKKIKSILDSGRIGRLVSIDHTENVVFWHEAHSYVRGNWHKRANSTPMILAKCCHDLDLIQYFVDSRCKAISSMGSLFYFKKENMPIGASDRCVKCKYIESCKYSAKKIYVDMWKEMGKPESTFPFTLITDVVPLTEEALLKAIETTDYGKCVFQCDNDVVDNQTTIMQFENGVTATLKMEAFVKYGGRDIRFFGTEGELDLNEEKDEIILKRYFEEDKKWKISELIDELGGQGEGWHGGGDHRMIDRLYYILTDQNVKTDTSLSESCESHYMAIAAEDSRLCGGKLIYLDEYRK